MRFRRCGSASEAWKAKASRTSRERRPMEGPQRTSSGDALGSPERPRPSVARQNRPHRETGTTVKARGAKPAAGRQMSRRWTFSPRTRAELHTPTKWRKTRNAPRAPAVPFASSTAAQARSCHQSPQPVHHHQRSPPSSAARGSPMRIRRCGSASEAWRVRASRTSRERRPTEGPQRASGGDALGSPERPHGFAPFPLLRLRFRDVRFQAPTAQSRQHDAPHPTSQRRSRQPGDRSRRGRQAGPRRRTAAVL